MGSESAPPPQRPTPGIDALLSHAGWLRRLALALARDADAAEDLVQETWLAALRHPPDPSRQPRPWLAEVVRNALRMRLRSDSRRAARDHAAAAPETEPSAPGADALLERAEASRCVVEAVLALDEPYRGTVLLRYFDGLSAVEIARAQAVPDGTVRWRLKEALRRLRAALDTAPGGRGAWLVLAALPEGALMMKKTKIIATVLVLLLGLGAATWLAIRSGDRSSRTDWSGAAPLRPGADSRAAVGDDGGAGKAGAAPDAASAWNSQPGVVPRRVAGRVLHRGQPVPGAEVILVDWGTAAIGGAEARVLTDAEGRFAFLPLKASWYLVSASAQERAAVTVNVDLRVPEPPLDALVLELGDCSASVEGRVTDVNGEPIAGAFVQLGTPPQPGPFGPIARAAADGRYRLCVPRGDVYLAFAAPGHGRVQTAVLARGRQRVDVTLTPESVVIGRTVDAVTGEPLAGVQVELWPPSRGFLSPDSAFAVSDATGQFQVSGVAAGRYLVGGWAREHVLVEAQEITVDPGLAAGPFTVRLERGACVSGLVRVEGKPLAGAFVSMASTDRTRKAGTGAFVASEHGGTQADGRFTACGVPVGAEVLPIVVNHRVRDARPINVDRPRVDGLIIEVERLGGIEGVVERDGQPVVGAVVLAQPRDSQARFRKTESGAGGRFRFDGLVAGRYLLVADNGEAFSMEQPVVAVADGEISGDVRLELDGAAGASGQVVDQRGAPVVGAQVWLQRADGDDRGESITDIDGGFEIAMLTGGDYHLQVRQFRGAEVPLDLAAGQVSRLRIAGPAGRADGLRIVVVRHDLSIAGTVVDDQGAAVPDAVVLAGPSGGGRVPSFSVWVPWPSARSDAGGRFSIPVWNDEVYALQAQAGGGVATTVSDVRGGARDVVIRVERPGAISGTLVNLPASQVWARRAGGVDFPSTSYLGRIDGDRFAFPALPPGSYLVQATARDGRAAAARVEVRAGATSALKLASAGTASIRGRVLDFRDGKPVSGLVCSAAATAAGDDLPANDPAGGARSGEDGGFVIAAAPLGLAVVRCGGAIATVAEALVVTTVIAGENRLDLYVVRLRGEERPGNTGMRLSRHLAAPVVVAVRAGSSASTTGVLAGDRVVAVDGADVTALSPLGVDWLIGDRPQGTLVTITFSRGGATRTVQLTVEPPWD